MGRERSASMAERGSPTAAGFVFFAGIMMVVTGIFEAIEGFAAIIKNEFFVVTPNYAYKIDASAWGWIHLILGIVVVLAGLAVFRGALWGRLIGITIAGLSAIANFFFIPYYPFWSILIIALDVFVIWALAAHGRELADVA
jgi:hypothetical protein